MEHKINPWMISTLVLVGLIVGFGAGQLTARFQTGGNGAAVAAVPSDTRGSAPEAKNPEEVAKAVLDENDPFLGEEDAPITVVEFSDFQCPFCARFFKETLGQIEENYIKTGKVKLVYRDFPLDIHPQAQKASEAAECAHEQKKFREMHDKIFDGQIEWSGNEKAADVFKKYAKTLGVDTAQFDSCLDSGKYESEVKKDLLDGIQAGVSGTPTFFINGREVSGAQPYSAFKGVFDALGAK